MSHFWPVPSIIKAEDIPTFSNTKLLLEADEPLFDCEMLRHLSDKQRNDLLLFQKLIDISPSWLRYASTELQNNDALLKYAITLDGALISELFFQNNRGHDRELNLLAVQCKSSAYACLVNNFARDFEFGMTAIKGGFPFNNLHPNLRKFKSLAIAAVEYIPGALQVVDFRWQNNKDVVLAAISLDPAALRFASKNIQNLLKNEPNPAQALKAIIDNENLTKTLRKKIPELMNDDVSIDTVPSLSAKDNTGQKTNSPVGLGGRKPKRM